MKTAFKDIRSFFMLIFSPSKVQTQESNEKIIVEDKDNGIKFTEKEIS